jgi:hypothetical protein
VARAKVRLARLEVKEVTLHLANAASAQSPLYDGRVAPEHRPKVVVAGETGQEATQGGERPEGNADADSGQEAGEGSGRQEDGVEAAAQVGLSGLLCDQVSRLSLPARSPIIEAWMTNGSLSASPTRRSRNSANGSSSGNACFLVAERVP